MFLSNCSPIAPENKKETWKYLPDLSPNPNWNQQWHIKTRTTYIGPKDGQRSISFSFFIDRYNLKINIYPECKGDSALHVYAKLCQLSSLDSRSCLEDYQWIINEPIKMHYQTVRPTTIKNKTKQRNKQKNIGYIKIK